MKADYSFFAQDRRKIQRNSRVEFGHLVVPELLQQDFLHHYHTSLEGGHHGVGRTYQRIWSNFHWRGLYRSVQRYVGECVDCTTVKGIPVLRGNSPGNVQATYPYQKTRWITFRRCHDPSKGTPSCIVGGSVLRVHDRKSEFLHNCTNDR